MHLSHTAANGCCDEIDASAMVVLKVKRERERERERERQRINGQCKPTAFFVSFLRLSDAR